jgi:anti-anti-sigma regulatory factor
MNPTGTAQIYSEKLEGAAEAAVLFAAGHLDAAVDVLRAAVADVTRSGDPVPWLMLFEMYHCAAKREEFDALAVRYRNAFDRAPPPWGYPARVSSPGMLPLEGVLSSRETLSSIIQHAYDRKTLAIDMGRVDRITLDFAPGFCEAMRTLYLQGKRVFLANISEANAALIETFGTNPDLVFLRRKPAAEVRRSEELIAA